MAELERTNGKPANLPGVYRHEASGKELIVLPDPQSTAQQDALVRMGYVWVAEPPTRQELLVMQQAQAKKDAEAEKSGEITAPEAPAPDAPKFNGTVTTLEADLEAANERAAQAEAALAALQAEPQAEETVTSDELQPEVAAKPVKRTPAKRTTNKKGK